MKNGGRDFLGHYTLTLVPAGDMYESTMQALTALYPKLSPGGFLYVDDYDTYKACRKAVDEYRLVQLHSSL